jgi:hypothetical protein
MIRNWDDLYLNDAYNEFGTRTRKNVEGWKFNCGGYALETYNWICPYATEDDSDRLFDDWYSELSNDDRVEETATWMEKHVPNLRRVNGVEDLHDDEYLIAYKCGTSDFHFCKRLPNGIWMHKPGSSRTRRISEKTVMADKWINGVTVYSSKTVFFAKKLK